MPFFRATTYKEQKIVALMDEKRQLEKDVEDWKRKYAEMPEPSSLAPAAGEEAASAAPSNSGEQHAGKDGQVQVLQEMMAKLQEERDRLKRENEALVKDAGRDGEKFQKLENANQYLKEMIKLVEDDRNVAYQMSQALEGAQAPL